jgi:hypothetical protein
MFFLWLELQQKPMYYCGGSWNEMEQGLSDLTTKLSCARLEISVLLRCACE